MLHGPMTGQSCHDHGWPPGLWSVGHSGAGVDTRSLSYDEIADMLGIERESARHLAFRRRWRRTKGNDGKARVEVPLEALAQLGPASPTGSRPDTSTDTTTDTRRVPSRAWRRF